MPFSIWWALPGFVGLIGILLLVGGLGRLFKLQLIGGGFRFLFGGVVLAAAAVVALVGLNLQTYSRLTHEQLAAEVTLKQTGPGQFTASFVKFDKAGRSGAAKDFALTGDSFRVEADVILFQPWANIVGADALYRFNRIQGRFECVAQEHATPPVPHDLADNAGIDLFWLPLGKANPLKHVDAEFTDGNAVPMADGAVYQISMSQKGLVSRPYNDVAIAAVENRHGCAVDKTGPPSTNLSAPGPVQLTPPTAPAPTH